MENRSKLILKKIPVSPNDDYRAGSDGKIYSRTKYAGFGRKYKVDWYPLKGHKNDRGYYSVSLCHENKKVTKTVHRLICMAFHGLPEKPTLQARHLDGNSCNNDPKNLMWGTQQENWQDRISHGRGNKGDQHFASKIKDSIKPHIVWAIENNVTSIRNMAKVLGVTQGIIQRIVRLAKESSVKDRGGILPSKEDIAESL